jgi:hypothetical protein
MRKPLFVTLASLAAVLVLAGGLFVSTRGTVAQDMASPAAGGPDHPAHIHDGTCDTLGGVVYPLNNLKAPEASATPVPAMEMAMASPMADSEEMDMSEVESFSVTDVEVTLDDLLAAPYAINVHESSENIQNYIACGDLTGTPTDNKLEIKLEELNESELEGAAVLEDNGDGTTTVTVWLKEYEEEATPTS